MEEAKQIIVIRKDLKMRRGKEIAQGAHASMRWMAEWMLMIQRGHQMVLTPEQSAWLQGGFPKICVKVETLDQLMDLHVRATEARLVSMYITDEGRTEFKGQKTITALAIGPHYADKLDPITRELELY